MLQNKLVGVMLIEGTSLLLGGFIGNKVGENLLSTSRSAHTISRK